MPNPIGPRDTVILSAVRTPVGKFGGAFREFDALKLGVAAATAALERAGVRGEQVDEVIFGSGGQPIETALELRVLRYERGDVRL